MSIAAASGLRAVYQWVFWPLALGLAVPANAGPAEPASGGEATVFLRAIGDRKIEHLRPWGPPQETLGVELGTGTGFLVSPAGLILTSRHVVAVDAEPRETSGGEMRVTQRVRRVEAIVRAGGEVRSFEAALLAEDAEQDLALLSVAGSNLPYVPLGDSDAADPGSAVRVLGYPLGRRVEVALPDAPEAGTMPGVSVSPGALAARRADQAGELRFLQTDATLNPGNSGGPMLDGDGYALGVVRMKMTRADRIGFVVPINAAKDFLERQGLLAQLPSRRLHPGRPQGFEGRGVRMALPDELADESRSRLQVLAGGPEAELRLVVERVASPWSLAQIESALVTGEGWPGPTGFRGQVTRRAERRGRLSGSARGTDAEGRARVLEYALVDLGREKLVARFESAPDPMAFNLSVVRGSLESLEAERLLTDDAGGEIKDPELRSVAPPPPDAPPALLPARFWAETLEGAGCGELRSADATLLASPVGDFTLSLRWSFWRGSEVSPESAARLCGREAGGLGPASYADLEQRLGVELVRGGLFLRSGEGLLRLEVEAPRAKWDAARELWRRWAGANGAAAR
jgi:hypothetical protein